MGTILPDIPIAVRLRDAQGRDSFLAALDQDGNATIRLSDANGTAIWSAP